MNTAVSAWGALSGASSNTVIGSSGIVSKGLGQNLQQAVFQQFYLYWRNRTLFTIQTPWAVFANMIIEELRAQQEESTRVITDFYISFKMMRFSTTFLETPSTFDGVGRAGVTQADLGQTNPAPSIPMTTGLGSLTISSSIPAPP
jgi:hypothetical protein